MRRLAVVLVVLAACGCRQESQPEPFKEGERLEVWIGKGRHEAAMMDWEGANILTKTLKAGDAVMFLEVNPKPVDDLVRVRVLTGESESTIGSFNRTWLRRPAH